MSPPKHQHDPGGASVEALQVATNRFLEVGQSIFPLQFPRGERFFLLMRCAGLVARIVGAGETAVALSRRNRRADLATVIRSMYEHVVMLAWITGNREESRSRLMLWQKADDVASLKYDREVSKLSGEPVFDAETRALLQKDVAELEGHDLPDLASRCVVADREWAGVAGFGDPAHPELALRSIYSSLYRALSGAVHPSAIGLELVSNRTPELTIIDIEPPGEGGPTFGVASALLNTALLISHHIIGRPSADLLEKALDDVIRDVER